jgi:hypothetical protein
LKHTGCQLKRDVHVDYRGLSKFIGKVVVDD